MLIFICNVCNKEFKSKQALGGHKTAAHKSGPRYAVKRKINKTKDAKIFECQFCHRQTTNAGANKKHENSCSKNPNYVKGGRKPGYKGTNQFIKATELGLDKPVSSLSTRKKLSQANLGKKQSQQTKEKISKSRIKYLSENPDKVPYKLNHYSKGPSYPERYWKKIFDKFGIKYTEQYQIHIYQLDFALIDAKIDIEIDGEQHYLDERIVESDKRRNKYLENLGWKIIRIRWSNYKKLVDKQDRRQYIDTLIEQIRTATQVDKRTD